MKIKLSKSQWEMAGRKAGWMKTSTEKSYWDASPEEIRSSNEAIIKQQTNKALTAIDKLLGAIPLVTNTLLQFGLSAQTVDDGKGGKITAEQLVKKMEDSLTLLKAKNLNVGFPVGSWILQDAAVLHNLKQDNGILDLFKKTAGELYGAMDKIKVYRRIYEGR